MRLSAVREKILERTFMLKQDDQCKDVYIKSQRGKERKSKKKIVPVSRDEK